jgi:hypothetical protein
MVLDSPTVDRYFKKAIPSTTAGTIMGESRKERIATLPGKRCLAIAIAAGTAIMTLNRLEIAA